MNRTELAEPVAPGHGGDGICADPGTEELVPAMLSRLADKWTVLTIGVLAEAEQHFSWLRQRLGHVGQKMLTRTLRPLERDGLELRRVQAVVPPRVDYRLTRLGHSLGEAVCSLWIWAGANLRILEQTRQNFNLQANLTPKEPA